VTQKKLIDAEIAYIQAHKIAPKEYNWDTVTLREWVRDNFLHQPEFHGQTGSKDFEALLKEAVIQVQISKTSLENLLEKFELVMKSESTFSIRRVDVSPESEVAIFGDLHGSKHGFERGLLKLK
jgi:hypothetical protein